MGDAAEKLSGSTPPNTPPGLIPWKPGQSGNPAGRPKGGIGLATYIREHTLEGRELVDFLLEVVRTGGEDFKGRDRLTAVEMLMDRAFGKVLPVNPEPSDKLKPVLDLDKFTEKELEFLESVRLGLVAISDRIRGAETQADVQ